MEGIAIVLGLTIGFFALIVIGAAVMGLATHLAKGRYTKHD